MLMKLAAVDEVVHDTCMSIADREAQLRGRAGSVTNLQERT